MIRNLLSRATELAARLLPPPTYTDVEGRAWLLLWSGLIPSTYVSGYWRYRQAADQTEAGAEARDVRPPASAASHDPVPVGRTLHVARRGFLLHMTRKPQLT